LEKQGKTKQFKGRILIPVYVHNNCYWYDNMVPRMAFPVVGKTKEDDWSRFQLSSAWRQI